MLSSVDAAASPACIASTSSASRHQKRVDFLTRYCGSSLPTLFKRIGIMAVDGHPLPTRFDAARLRRVGRLKLPGTPASHLWDCEDTTDHHRVRTCRRAGSRDTVRVGKGFDGPIKPADTTPTVVASGPPMCLHRRGSTTGNGWWSPSRQAGRSLFTHPGATHERPRCSVQLIRT